MTRGRVGGFRLLVEFHCMGLNGNDAKPAVAEVVKNGSSVFRQSETRKKVQCTML